jgi:phage FluMu protein gp41
VTKAVVCGADGVKRTATYVDAERNDKGLLVATGTLKRGLKIGTELHQEFALQEALTADLLAAELKAQTDTPLNFNTQVLVRQLVRIGSFTGPFTSELLAALRPFDFNRLRAAQNELEIVGEVIE